jgi:hypothetical protein
MKQQYWINYIKLSQAKTFPVIRPLLAGLYTKTVERLAVCFTVTSDKGDSANNLESLESSQLEAVRLYSSAFKKMKPPLVYPNPIMAMRSGTKQERQRKIYFFNLPSSWMQFILLQVI